MQHPVATAASSTEDRIGLAVADLGRRYTHAFAMLVVAFTVTALPIVVSEVNKGIAIAACALVALVTVNFLPKTVPVVFVVSVIFQNLFVALVSPYVTDKNDLNFVRGFNFLTIVIFFLFCWLYTLYHRERFNRPFLIFFYGSTIALVTIGLYFGYGAAKSPAGAVIYLRNIALPMMIFQISLVVAYSFRPNVTTAITCVALIVMSCGYLELFFRQEWFDLTNSETYWFLNATDFRESGAYESIARQYRQVYTGVLDNFRVVLFNTALLKDLEIEVLRLNGPNFHSISFAYSAGFLTLFLFAAGRWVLFALMLPLLVFASAKGAMIVLVVTLTMVLASRFFQGWMVFLGFICLMALYIPFVIITGLSHGDYHVLGLIGGINGFLGNPVGHGIGSGGNLATNFGTLDWSAAQAQGETAGAVESAIGVLLFQMGIAAFVVIGFYLYIAWTVWRLYDRYKIPQFGVAGYGLFVILVNGLFQEEALFSPLSLGLMVAFAGLILGSAARTGALESVLAPRRERPAEAGGVPA